MKNRNLLFFLILILSVKCSDESIDSKDFPYVITKEAQVENDRVILNADVLNIGTVVTKKYGFLISEVDPPALTNAIEIKDRAFVSGEYALTIQSGIKNGTTYYVRAYAKTPSQVVYGNTISFEGKGSLPPKVVSFSPEQGPIGTPVVITGENLGYVASGTTVKFGETTAVIDSITDSRIYTKVPVVTQNQKVKITIETGGHVAQSDNLFDLWFPWTRKADFPGTYLWQPTSFEANGKLYVLGGLRINPWEVKNEFWMYDPQSDSWERKPDFPGPLRYEAVAFSCNNKGYYGLGINSTGMEYLSDFWEYDPAGELWTQKASIPAGGRSRARSFVIQNKGYIALGYGSTVGAYYKDVWEYDPASNSWTDKHDWGFGERYPGFSVTGTQKAYLGMGTNGWHLDDIYEYDPVANVWQLIGNYPGNGANFMAGLYINDKIYMGLGSDSGTNSFADFWEFDAALGSWKKMHPCPTKLSPFSSVTIGDKGYVGYGWYDLSWNDEHLGRAFYEFDPSRN